MATLSSTSKFWQYCQLNAVTAKIIAKTAIDCDPIPKRFIRTASGGVPAFFACETVRLAKIENTASNTIAASFQRKACLSKTLVPLFAAIIRSPVNHKKTRPAVDSFPGNKRNPPKLGMAYAEKLASRAPSARFEIPAPIATKKLKKFTIFRNSNIVGLSLLIAAALIFSSGRS